MVSVSLQNDIEVFLCSRMLESFYLKISLTCYCYPQSSFTQLVLFFPLVWPILSWEVCYCLVFSWLTQSTGGWWGSPKHCFDLRLALNACWVQIMVGPPLNNKSILHCTIIIFPHCSRCYCWPSHSIHTLFWKIPTYSSCVSYRYILNEQSDISIMWRRVSCQCHGES